MAAILLVAASTDVTGQRRPLDIAVKIVDGVDYCSSDSTFIVIIDCGTLSNADSLLLYDISIRYPATKVSFKQVLYQGTLSENIESKGFGSRDTGEVRVYGFNVARFLTGAKPLVALLFRHTAVCTDSLRIGFSNLPEFNPEAKVYIREAKSDVVRFYTTSTSGSLKFQFSNDTIVLKQGVSSFRTVLGWRMSGQGRIRGFSLRLKSSAEFQIDSTSCTDGMLVKTSKIADGFFLRVEGGQNTVPLSDSLNLFLSSTADFTRPVPIIISDFTKDTCSCVVNAAMDSLHVAREMISSVDADDCAVDMASDGDVWEIENRTATGLSAEIFDLAGQVIWKSFVAAQAREALNAGVFARGLYFVRFSTPTGLYVKKLKVWK
ncbi:MAG: T9SS type A sorting domain-containing protein [Candidatus Kapaibacterium sp.]